MRTKGSCGRRGLMLRRLASATLVISMLAPPAFAAGGASAPKTDVTVGQVAFAIWVIPGRGHATVYIATAGKRVDDKTGAIETVAALGSGRCRMIRGRVDPHCVVMAKSAKIADDAFEIDPLLGSAHLDLGNGRHRQRVIWTGIGDHQVTPISSLRYQAGVVFVDVFAAGGALVGRGATVRGHLFGTELRERHATDAYMSERAVVMYDDFS
jgi:hypothetical protein